MKLLSRNSIQNSSATQFVEIHFLREKILTSNYFVVLKLAISLIVLYLTPLRATALTSDNSLPANISADSAVYDHDQHLSIYRGHVNIIQGTTHLQGDIVMIYNQSNQQIQKIIAIGRPAIYKTLPDHQTEDLYARGKRIEFYPSQHRVILIGDGKITDSKNTFSGARIVYLIDKQTISATASSAQPETKIVIQPNLIK